MRVVSVAVFLALAIILGGGTRPGFLGDTILQIASIPLLVSLVLAKPYPRHHWASHLNLPGALLLLFALLILLQLVPLPSPLLNWLTAREHLIPPVMPDGAQFAWQPLSLAPEMTALALASTLPPVAVFFAVSRLSYRSRRWIVLVLLVMAALSAMLGLLQIATGPKSGLRFFEFTNINDAVGFFANRNHFAAFMYCVIPLTIALIVDRFPGAPTRSETTASGNAVPILLALAVLLALLIAGVLMSRSRAGLGLTMVALVGGTLIAIAAGRGKGWFSAAGLIGIVSGLIALSSLQFALYRILSRFDRDPLEDARIPFGQTTLEAATALFPWGGGAGTFVPVYALFEKPGLALAGAYANHAHNDYLEFWLEMGVPGAILLAAFALWLVVRFGFVVFDRVSAAKDVDGLLMTAALVSILLFAVHSIVDYPLRTAALACVFASLTAMLTRPPGHRQRDTGVVETGIAHPNAGKVTVEPVDQRPSPSKPAGAPRQRETASGPARPPLRSGSTEIRGGVEIGGDKDRRSASEAGSRQGRKWGEGTEWPDEWRPGAKSDQKAKPKE